MIIPEHIKHLKFVKILKGQKIAFEKEWQNRPYTAEQIQSWVDEGNNYGVICESATGIGMIDADCSLYVNLIENFLPKTFSVQSSEGKRHFYYKFAGFPHNTKKIVLVYPEKENPNNLPGGDIRLGNFYVVAPGSIHPDTKQEYKVIDDAPIAEIAFDEIVSVLGQYFETSLFENSPKSSSKEITIQQVLDFYKIELKKSNSTGECFTAHPKHGSASGGTNFGVNINKDVWCCRRHNTGGSTYELIAMMEGILTCEQCTKGALIGENFLKVLEILEDKFGVKKQVNPPKERQTITDKRKKKHFEEVMETALNDEKLNKLVGYNKMAYDIQFLKGIETIEKGEFLQKKHESILAWYFLREHDLQCSRQTITQFLDIQSDQNSFHPVKDLILPIKWDGVERLDNWFSQYTGCELNAYTSKVGRMVICAAVKRIMEPGCKFDYMVILEGRQGLKKSMFWNTLGGDFYEEISFGADEKRIIENMQGAWFIEISELNGFKRQEADWLKSFITRKSDKTRLAYERRSGPLLRHNIFVGTFNPSGDNEFLKDDTGNRRFIPIVCGEIDIEGLKKVRSQLFAEALLVYKNEELYLKGEAKAISENEQSVREETDIWLSLVIDWLITKDVVTTAEILKECIRVDLSRATIGDKMRIGKIMKKLKWTKKQDKFGCWFYKRPGLIEVAKEESVLEYSE